MKKLTELTPKEYYNYFNDCLTSLISRTFSNDKALVFLSYQPTEHTLDPAHVMEDTNVLFHQNRYIEVIERTFKTSRLYNDGGYTDGFHSHIIMTEAEYNIIKDQISDLDIVAKLVYNLNGLINYLSKQAGTTYHRLLPKRNIPIGPGPGKIIVEKVITPLKKRLVMLYKAIHNTISKINTFIVKPIYTVTMTVKRFLQDNDS